MTDRTNPMNGQRIVTTRTVQFYVLGATAETTIPAGTVGHVEGEPFRVAGARGEQVNVSIAGHADSLVYPLSWVLAVKEELS